MPSVPVVARAALHFWEEPCISGENGSGTVFFSGCSLRCVYCQNSKISSECFGKKVSEKALADIFRRLEQEGAHNINLVTPTHFVPAVINALDIYRPSVPVVYNSSGYDNVEILKLLEDYVDIYLMDYKYKDPSRAELFSNAADYPYVAARSLSEAYRQKPVCKFNNGIMTEGVIVRHLLLPQATNEAIEIFEDVRKNMPNAYFSLMAQYTPCGRAENIKPINRKITAREYNKVFEHIAESGFENCFIQELESSDKRYIPSFEFEGV